MCARVCILSAWDDTRSLRSMLCVSHTPPCVKSLCCCLLLPPFPFCSVVRKKNCAPCRFVAGLVWVAREIQIYCTICTMYPYVTCTPAGHANASPDDFLVFLVLEYEYSSTSIRVPPLLHKQPWKKLFTHMEL
jgi:hypothetical protein